MILRSPMNYDRDAVSVETGLSCPEKGRTQQSSKDEADINVIVRRFGVTGQLPQGVANPAYIDFDGVFDFQSAMNVVRQAQESFMAMPADVRERFANDPQRFVEFCSDEKNLDEMRKLGLAVAEKPVVVPAPVVPVVVAPPGTP